jgi:hypothetical protein
MRRASIHNKCTAVFSFRKCVRIVCATEWPERRRLRFRLQCRLDYIGLGWSTCSDATF